MSADDLVAAVYALWDASAPTGPSHPLRQRLAPGAIVFVPTDTNTTSLAGGPPQLWLTEVASGGDFGYTVSVALEGTSGAWQVLVWRRQQGGVWMVEAAIQTHHPGPVQHGEATVRVAKGWVRARRPLYQEAARVAMLKADRDLALSSIDVGTTLAFAEVLADSVLYLEGGQAPAEGRRLAAEQIAQVAGVVTWIPSDGAVARAGDLGYTYGLQTVRPPAPDALLQTSRYFRVWRALPDSTWEVVVNVQQPPLAVVK